MFLIYGIVLKVTYVLECAHRDDLTILKPGGNDIASAVQAKIRPCASHEGVWGSEDLAPLIPNLDTDGAESSAPAPAALFLVKSSGRVGPRADRQHWLKEPLPFARPLCSCAPL